MMGMGAVGAGSIWHSGHVVVGAVVLDPAALPEGAQGDDHFVEALAPGGEVLAGLVELLLAPADADAEADPVVGEHGGRADRLGHRDQVAGRGDVDAGGEEQVFGDGGQGGNDAHRIGPRGFGFPPGRAVFSLGVGVLGLERAGVEEVVGNVDAAVPEVVARPWPAAPPAGWGGR